MLPADSIAGALYHKL